MGFYVYQGEARRVYAAPPIHFKGTGAGHGVSDLDQGTCLPGLLKSVTSREKRGGEGVSLETPVHEGGCLALYRMGEDLAFAKVAPWRARCERRGAAPSGHREDKPPRCALRRASPR